MKVCNISSRTSELQRQFLFDILRIRVRRRLCFSPTPQSFQTLIKSAVQRINLNAFSQSLEDYFSNGDFSDNAGHIPIRIGLFYCNILQIMLNVMYILSPTRRRLKLNKINFICRMCILFHYISLK